MPKNKTSFLSKLSKISTFLLRTIELIVLFSIVGIALFLWQKPEYLIKWLNVSNNNLSTINSAKIDAIDNKLTTLEIITKSNAEKSDLIQQNFDNFTKSKADNEQIISLNEQIIKLGNQINEIHNTTKKLSQTSNTGALLLTSAIMIRDNTMRGINCKNEAEGLKILAQNIDSVSHDIDFVVSYCNSIFISNNTLINNFNNIYNKIEVNLTPQIQEQNWKQRLSSKVGEYIQITNRNQPQKDEINPLTTLLPIKQFVNNNDFSMALNELSKEENQNLMLDEDLKNWFEQAKNNFNFYKSLSNIINASLSIMKVEDAKNIAD